MVQAAAVGMGDRGFGNCCQLRWRRHQHGGWGILEGRGGSDICRPFVDLPNAT
jgi:hypothetical protein